METRKCKTCGLELPLSEFAACTLSKDGLQTSCKQCRSKLIREGHARKGVAAPPSPPALSLANIPDEELFAELGRRGFSGEVVKTVKI